MTTRDYVLRVVGYGRWRRAANGERHDIGLTLSEVMRDAQVDRRTARRCLAALIEDGLIVHRASQRRFVLARR